MSSTMNTPMTNQTTESPREARANADLSLNWIIGGCLGFGVVFFTAIVVIVIVVLVRKKRARQHELDSANVSSGPVYNSGVLANTVSLAQHERRVSSGQINASSPGTNQRISSDDSGNQPPYDYPRRPSSPVYNFKSQPTSPVSPHLPRLSPSPHSPGTVNPGYNSLDSSLLHGGARYPQYASLKSVESPYDHLPSSKHKEPDYDRLPLAKPVASDYYPLSSVSPQQSDYDRLPTSRVANEYNHLPLSKVQSSDYDHLPVPKAVSSGYNCLPVSKTQSSDYDLLPWPIAVYSDCDERSLISDYDYLPAPVAAPPDNEHRPLSSDYDRLPAPRRLVSKVLSSDYDTLPGTVRPVQPLQDHYEDDARLQQTPPTPLPRRSKKPCDPVMRFNSPFNVASNKDRRNSPTGHPRAPHHSESTVVGTVEKTNQCDSEEEPIYANF